MTSEKVGINRNIVECKLHLRGIPYLCCGSELIETLWNVNPLVVEILFKLEKELIETLWNVNDISGV